MVKLVNPIEERRQYGPLGAVWHACKVVFNRKAPVFQRLFSFFDKLLFLIFNYMDSAIDRKYGIETSGIVSANNLEANSENLRYAVWYEPMPEKIFRRIMGYLNIDFGAFEFIDFGSGKGRVLIMAAPYGFKKVTGVEFSPELHRIAANNIEIYRQHTHTSTIESVCMDAVHFPIPEAPLVMFFYSPFTGNALAQVLTNISASLRRNPRDIVLLLYGSNPYTLAQFQSTGFRCTELTCSADWWTFQKYRSFLFKSRQ